MKGNIFFRAITALAAVAFIMPLTTGCSDNYYEYGADLYSDSFTVRVADWDWNDRYNRWEYVFDYDEIDNYIFNYGSVAAGVYIDERGPNGTYTTLKSLPFVYSYYDGEIPVTEIISFDLSLGSIAFYVQTTDMERVTDFLKTYDFKVTLFWSYNN